MTGVGGSTTQTGVANPEFVSSPSEEVEVVVDLMVVAMEASFGKEIAKASGVDMAELQMSTTLDVVDVVEASDPRTLTFSRTYTPAASKTSTIGAWPRVSCILCTNNDFNLFTCPSTTKTKSIITRHSCFHLPGPEYKFSTQLFKTPGFITADHLRGSFPNCDS